jgi:hypothetical protein
MKNIGLGEMDRDVGICMRGRVVLEGQGAPVDMQRLFLLENGRGNRTRRRCWKSMPSLGESAGGGRPTSRDYEDTYVRRFDGSGQTFLGRL